MTFPRAPIYTSLYVPAATFPEFADHDVRPLWTNRLAALRRDHRRGLPLYPLAYSATSIDAAVTLCSSSGFAHGVRYRPARRLLLHPRWLYGQAAPYVLDDTFDGDDCVTVGGDGFDALVPVDVGDSSRLGAPKKADGGGQPDPCQRGRGSGARIAALVMATATAQGEGTGPNRQIHA